MAAIHPDERERIFLRSGESGILNVTISPIGALMSGDRPDPAAHNTDLSMVHNLDELPYPDFDDYFARWAISPLRAQIDPLLFYETSRGCWWGQKHQCKFCGLNGNSLAFRSKSPRRAVGELRHLVERYGVHKACSADNIFDHRYFDTFLPMLQEAKLNLGFVYEMKAYYYEYDYADGRDPMEYVEPVLDAVEKWRQLHGSVTLRAWDRPDGLLIVHDTRPCAKAFQHRMTGLDRDLYLYCDTGRSLKKVLQFAAEHAGGRPVEPEKVERLLDQWIDDRLMIHVDGRYLSLALWAPKEGG